MKTLSLVLLLLCLGPASYSDRDVVYAARYYAPPGSHRTTHAHLYRISSDGTGKTQLTTGLADDDLPLWSPDGEKITFLRTGPSGQTTLCLIGGSGGTVRTLHPAGAVGRADAYAYHWSPDGRTLAVAHENSDKDTVISVSLMDTRTWQVTRRFAGASRCDWSPDSRRLLLVRAAGSSIFRLPSGPETPLTVSLYQPRWLNADTLAGFPGEDHNPQTTLRLAGLDGKEKKTLALTFPVAYRDFEPGGLDMLFPGPPRQNALIYALNNHNSTVGTDYLFLTLPTATGKLRYLTQGQFLSWSPDGLQLCTAPGRDTTPYEKRANPRPGDAYRLVWTAPLYVRAAGGGPMRALTPRLSFVTAADWRSARPLTPLPPGQKKK
jgi:dipeptidyl aminopeptidase/acylaminoacyl peptidase